MTALEVVHMAVADNVRLVVLDLVQAHAMVHVKVTAKEAAREVVWVVVEAIHINRWNSIKKTRRFGRTVTTRT